MIFTRTVLISQEELDDHRQPAMKTEAMALVARQLADDIVNKIKWIEEKSESTYTVTLTGSVTVVTKGELRKIIEEVEYSVRTHQPVILNFGG